MSDSRDGFTVEVTFFCTGKGTHPRREIGPIDDRRRAGLAEIVETFAPHADSPDARDDLGVRGQRWRRPGRDGEEIVSRSKSVRLKLNGAGERTWELTCPVCPTNVRPSDKELMAVLDAVGRGGAPWLLDISTWR